MPNTFKNLSARLSNSELAAVIHGIRPGFLIALRIAVLSLAALSTGAWFFYGSSTASLLLLPALVLIVVRIVRIRHETQAYQMIEKLLNEQDLAGVIDGTKKMLAWGPIAGSKFRTALFAILAEVAWRRNLDDDALTICDFIIANAARSRQALVRALLLGTQIHAFKKNLAAANETFQKFQKQKFQLKASGLALLYFVECILAFCQGKREEVREILKTRHKSLQTLDEKRLEILKTLTSLKE